MMRHGGQNRFVGGAAAAANRPLPCADSCTSTMCRESLKSTKSAHERRDVFTRLLNYFVVPHGSTPAVVDAIHRRFIHNAGIHTILSFLLDAVECGYTSILTKLNEARDAFGKNVTRTQLASLFDTCLDFTGVRPLTTRQVLKFLEGPQRATIIAERFERLGLVTVEDYFHVLMNGDEDSKTQLKSVCNCQNFINGAIKLASRQQPNTNFGQNNNNNNNNDDDDDISEHIAFLAYKKQQLKINNIFTAAKPTTAVVRTISTHVIVPIFDKTLDGKVHVNLSTSGNNKIVTSQNNSNVHKTAISKDGIPAHKEGDYCFPVKILRTQPNAAVMLGFTSLPTFASNAASTYPGHTGNGQATMTGAALYLLDGTRYGANGAQPTPYFVLPNIRYTKEVICELQIRSGMSKAGTSKYVRWIADGVAGPFVDCTGELNGERIYAMVNLTHMDDSVQAVSVNELKIRTDVVTELIRTYENSLLPPPTLALGCAESLTKTSSDDDDDFDGCDDDDEEDEDEYEHNNNANNNKNNHILAAAKYCDNRKQFGAVAATCRRPLPFADRSNRDGFDVNSLAHKSVSENGSVARSIPRSTTESVAAAFAEKQRQIAFFDERMSEAPSVKAFIENLCKDNLCAFLLCNNVPEPVVKTIYENNCSGREFAHKAFIEAVFKIEAQQKYNISAMNMLSFVEVRDGLLAPQVVAASNAHFNRGNKLQQTFAFSKLRGNDNNHNTTKQAAARSNRRNPNANDDDDGDYYDLRLASTDGDEEMARHLQEEEYDAQRRGQQLSQGATAVKVRSSF